MINSKPSGVLDRYRKFLPVGESTPMVSIGEGDTPLVRAYGLERRIGGAEIWLKLEGCNPTGSFKDRGMALAVSKAIEDGARTLICASTGNTAASAAAFGAQTSTSTVVVIPANGVALGKVSQTLIHGAQVLSVRGSFDQGLAVVRELANLPGVAIVNSINPDRLAGQQTAAFEIVDSLGDAPNELYIPVGNAGNITAYWMGFVAYQKAGFLTNTPVLRGFQAAGASPIVSGQHVLSPETVASAIRIGNPANWKLAATACRQSEGTIEAVTDEEIIEAYRILASEEGVFTELSSAAAVAGLLKRARLGHDVGPRVVCVLTGSGLKDPGAAVRYASEPVEIEANVSAVAQHLGWDGI